MSPDEFIDRFRGRGEQYDCMVAISGGRDSTFAAHYAVKVLGCKVLLCTVDNGFVPKQTTKNVESARDALGADLVVVHNDRVRRNAGRVIRAWRRRPSASMVASFCAGCVSGCKGGLEVTAREYGLPLVITGTGEPQLRFGDLFLRLPKGRKGKLSILLGFARQLAANPFYLADPRCMFEFVREGRYRMGGRYRSQDRDGVLFVSAYDFVEWDEARILATIQAEMGWRSPSFSRATWRSDCRMHLVKQYMYLNLLGWTKNDMILSGLVRRGEITREEALRRVEQENQIPEDVVAETLDQLGVDFGALQRSLRMASPTTGWKQFQNPGTGSHFAGIARLTGHATGEMRACTRF
jgi:glucosamine--fructose-6-phosphate aminotransferase (isomerizing)